VSILLTIKVLIDNMKFATRPLLS